MGSEAAATCGKARKAKAHWTLQTWSFKIAAGLKVCASWKQLTTFNDWQIGYKQDITLDYVQLVIVKYHLFTPSLVQVHITQGEMRSAFPTSMLVDPTVHETRSFHSSKSIDGKDRQGTRGFLTIND